MATIGLSIMLAISLCLIAYLIYRENFKKNKLIRYYITVKFSGGNKSKLILKEEQYEQFKAWINQSEGLYDISSDTDIVTLNRKYVAAVEVKKR